MLSEALETAIRETRTPGALLAAHYYDEVRALVAPIVEQMARELPAATDLSALMIAANNEYIRRGGTQSRSLGGVIWALRALRSVGTNKETT